MTEHQEVSEGHAHAAKGKVIHLRNTARAFEDLFRESYGAVYNYVRYRMAGDDAAEDVVAEAFLRAARAFDRFDPSRAQFSTWVITIASNCMRDYWRRARPAVALEEIPENIYSQPDAAEAQASKDQIDRLLAILSSEERNLIVMKYREGYHNVEIAEKLGMNASTVSTKLFNAIAKMRSVIEED